MQPPGAFTVHRRLFALLVLLLQYASPVCSNSIWPFFGRDQFNTRRTDAIGPVRAPILQWSYLTGPQKASIAIVDDSSFVMSPDGGYLQRLTSGATGPNQQAQASVTYSATGYSAPLVCGAKVYVGSTDKSFYALQENNLLSIGPCSGTGTLPVISSGSVGADFTVYVGMGDSKSSSGAVLALNPCSTDQKWAFPVTSAVFSSPATDADGNVYFGTYAGYIMSVSNNGTHRWSTQLQGHIVSSVSINSRLQIVYVGTTAGIMYAVHPSTGAIAWQVSCAGSIGSTAAIGLDDNIYFASADSMYAINSIGSVVWSKAIFGVSSGADYGITSSPLVAGDGTLYIGWMDRNVYAVNSSDGSVLWQYDTASNISAAPVLGADGNIYMGTWSGLLAFSACPAGKFAAPFTKPTTCPAGSYCPRDSAQPTPCPAGTYSPATGNSAPTNCTKCGAGRYSTVVGATNASVCQACGAGNYCPSGNSQPIPCPAGTYGTDPLPVGLQSCTPCQLGSYSPVVGANDSAVCTTCSIGYYCSASAAMPCPSGTYNPNVAESNISACQLCTTGTYSTTIAAGTSDVCKSCPWGHYCPSISSEPVPCPTGSYNSIGGSFSPNDCVSCANGTYSDVPAATNNTCRDCPKGYFCPSISQSPTPCPAGSYSDGVNRTAASTCIYCTVGSYSAQPAASSSSACQLCQPGYYCLNISSLPTPCPPGSANNISGRILATDCKPCTVGSFAATAGSSACLICTAGGYCPSSTTGRIPCAAGTYNPLEGSSSPSACQHCPERGICGENTASPAFCPAESTPRCLMEHTDCLTNSLDCLPCPLCLAQGKCFSSYTGLLCNECPSGYYPSLQQCTRCGSPVAFLAVLFAVLIVALVAVYYFQRNRLHAFMFRVVINFMQIAALLALIQRTWPDYFNQFLEYLSLSGLSGGVASVRCFVPGWNIMHRFALSVLFPMLLVAFLGIARWQLNRRIQATAQAIFTSGGADAALSTREMKLTRYRADVERGVVLVLVIAYVSAVRYALSLWSCRDGYLVFDPEVNCGSTDLKAARAFSILVIIFVGAGFPLAILVWTLPVFRQKLGWAPKLDVRSPMFKVTEIYVSSMPWFEAVIMGSKFCYLIALHLLQDFYAQTSVCFVVATVYALLVIRRKPFYEYRVRWSEAFANWPCCRVRRAESTRDMYLDDEEEGVDLINAAERVSAVCLAVVYLVLLCTGETTGSGSQVLASLIVVLTVVVLISGFLPLVVRLQYEATIEEELKLAEHDEDDEADNDNENEGDGNAIHPRDADSAAVALMAQNGLRAPLLRIDNGEMSVSSAGKTDDVIRGAKLEDSLEKQWRQYTALRQQLRRQERAELFGDLERTAAELRKLNARLQRDLGLLAERAHGVDGAPASAEGVLLSDRLKQLQAHEEEDIATASHVQLVTSSLHDFETHCALALSRHSTAVQDLRILDWLSSAHELVAFGYESSVSLAELQWQVGRHNAQRARRVRQYRRKFFSPSVLTAHVCAAGADASKIMRVLFARVRPLQRYSAVYPTILDELQSFHDSWVLDGHGVVSSAGPLAGEAKRFQQFSTLVRKAYEAQRSVLSDYDGLIDGDWLGVAGSAVTVLKRTQDKPRDALLMLLDMAQTALKASPLAVSEDRRLACARKATLTLLSEAELLAEFQRRDRVLTEMFERSYQWMGKAEREEHADERQALQATRREVVEWLFEMYGLLYTAQLQLVRDELPGEAMLVLGRHERLRQATSKYDATDRVAQVEHR